MLESERATGQLLSDLQGPSAEGQSRDSNHVFFEFDV